MLPGTMRLMLACAALAAQTYKPEALSHAQIGVSQAQKQQYREAIQSYQKALAIDPTLPGLYLNLGLAWFKLGSFKEAITALDKENARAPSGQVATLLAMSYVGLKQYNEAAQRVKRLATAQRENTELSYLLGKCYLWSGQNAAAMEIFRSLLQRDPNSAAVHMLVGEERDGTYKTAEANAEFEAAAKASPMQADVHFGLGYLYWKQKRYEDAEGEFRRELKNYPGNAQAMAYLGDALMKAGKKSEAMELLQNAVTLDKNLRVAQFDLGILHAENKHTEPAIAAFREAIRIDPEREEAHSRLARLHQWLARTDEATLESSPAQTS